MKEGWTYKKLGDVCNINSGKSIKSSLIHSERKEGFSPCYGGNGLRGYVEMPNCNGGNPIIGRVGAQCGNVHYCDSPFYATEHALIVTLLDKTINPLWLCHLFSSMDLKQYAEGAAQPVIAARKLLSLNVSIPPMSVQQRIVERLDAAFENIDKLKANAEKLLAEAQTLFQKSLAKAMEPKEGWEEKKLKEIAQVRIGPFGSLLHKKDYISGGIPLVNPIHMVNGNIVANNDFTISNEKAKELSNYLLKENDIIFARRGEVGRCAIVTGKDEGSLCGTGSLFVRFLREIDSNFMLLLFQSECCKNYLVHNASGATMLNINAGIVEDMPLIIPSLSEQQRIVERLDALSENIRKYEEIQRQIISECDALKQALLRKVFE